jgi:hypothetical protein
MLETTVNSQFQFDKSLILWLTYTSSDKDGQVWHIVSNVIRTEYYLYKGKKKTKWMSDNPLTLYDHMK